MPSTCAQPRCRSDHTDRRPPRRRRCAPHLPLLAPASSSTLLYPNLSRIFPSIVTSLSSFTSNSPQHFHFQFHFLAPRRIALPAVTTNPYVPNNLHSLNNPTSVLHTTSPPPSPTLSRWSQFPPPQLFLIFTVTHVFANKPSILTQSVENAFISSIRYLLQSWSSPFCCNNTPPSALSPRTSIELIPIIRVYLSTNPFPPFKRNFQHSITTSTPPSYNDRSKV